MADRWVDGWSGTVEGRGVLVQKHEDTGSGRVVTTSLKDEPGSITVEDDSMIGAPSSRKGAPLDIAPETYDQLVLELIRDGGFSPAGAAEIASHVEPWTLGMEPAAED